MPHPHNQHPGNEPMAAIDRIHLKGGEDDDDPTAPEGEWSDNTATVDGVIHPNQEWRVDYEGTFWAAHHFQSQGCFEPGEVVRVVGRQGNKLLIQPLTER